MPTGYSVDYSERDRVAHYAGTVAPTACPVCLAGMPASHGIGEPPNGHPRPVQLTRRPVGCLGPKPGYEPVAPDGDYADTATFEYREDALAAIDRLNAGDRFGWVARPQYVGAYDRWTVTAHRRTGRHTRAGSGTIMVLTTAGTVR